VSVFNTENVNGFDGPVSNITGYAYIPDKKVAAKLKVHFDVAPVDADYWVVAVGPRTTMIRECAPCYDWAIVTDEFKLSLFVLARNVDQYNRLYNATVFDFLNKNGFTNFWNRPNYTPQDSTKCKYPPGDAGFASLSTL